MAAIGGKTRGTCISTCVVGLQCSFTAVSDGHHRVVRPQHPGNNNWCVVEDSTVQKHFGVGKLFGMGEPW